MLQGRPTASSATSTSLPSTLHAVTARGWHPSSPIWTRSRPPRIFRHSALQLKYAKIGLGQPFGSYFGADDKNVKNNIFQLSQGGLTLGQKDWYVNNDEATRKIREAYKKHIVRMFKLYGFDEAAAQQKAANVFRFETELALISKSNTELRDPQANYNKMTLKEFESNYPNIPLRKLANAEGINDSYIQEMNVGQPSFFNGLDKIASVMTADEWKAILEWDLINGSATALSDNIREANFDFFGRTMSGRKEDYPLWKRATNAVNGAMGEALGKMYCEKYFPESSKRMMEALIKNLQKSLAERIQAQTWMSDSTKKNALVKLSKFYVKVGYPNKWTDYSKLTIDPKKSYFENLIATRIFDNDKMIADKAGKPVDKDEWFMTPQTVNAYYNPTTNEICFPAGILQRPFFDPKADAAFNYGAIGVVIGHEMTHGFDDRVAASTTLTEISTTGGRHRMPRTSTSVPSSMPTTSTLSRFCQDCTAMVSSPSVRTSPTTED